MNIGPNAQVTGDGSNERSSLRRELEQCQRRIRELTRAELLLAGENRILELVAKGQPLSFILNEICRLVEEISGGSFCSILLRDANRDRLLHGAAPSIPVGYFHAFDGSAIGPEAGPCGRAVYFRKPVIVSDIAADPMGEEYRDLALAHGLRACWSTPILSSDARALGSLAMLSREPGSPTAQHQQLIAQVTHLAAVAIGRKQTEGELTRSEAYLAEAQKLSRTGSFGWKVSSGELIWSEETFCIMDYDRTIVPTLELVFERVHPDDVAYVRETLDRLAREGGDFDFEHRFLMPDGLVKHVHVVARPTKTESGEGEFVGAVMDVTERKKSQQALQRSEDHLRLLIDTIPGLVWTSTPDGHIDYLSKRWMDYTGMTMREGNGWGWQAAIHPDDLPGLTDYWISIITTGTEGEVEARLRRHDGEFRWFLFRCVPLHDEQGKLVKWYGANTDIDDRKRAEESLRMSEHLARGQVEVLKKTLDSLATESDPDRLVGHLLCAITEQFGAHSSSVWRRDETSGMIGLELAFEDGKVVPKNDARFAGMNLMLPMEDFWPWPEVFSTGKPSLIEDIETVQPFALRDRLLPLGIITVLLIPMSVVGTLEGAIGLRFTRKRGFRAEEIELAQVLANQAMLAMQLTRLSAESRESAVLAERNRMARDIHDTLAQGFTGVIMQLEAARGATAQGNLAETANRIERAGELARSSLGEARRSVRALRPLSLRDSTLFLAIDDLFKRMTDGSTLNADFQSDGDEGFIPADCEEDLLRITQEALTNAVKHAKALNFKATLKIRPDKIELRLVDDGCGFDPQMEHEGFGLLGMRERVVRMGGAFTVRAKPEVGTEILIELANQITAKPENRNEQI